MAGNLTLGRKKYAAVEPDIRALLEKGERVQARLMELVDADAAAFEPLSRAYSIPKDDPSRETVLEEATKKACAAPMAMNMGGDDFLAKPFDLNVLSAKVQALLRRAYDFSGPAQLLPCGEAVLNVSDGTLTAGAEKLELTRNELKILQMLLENRGRIVSRESLMTRLWESDAFVDENTLTVNVTRLRKKLGEAGLGNLIHTKKGAGYLVEGSTCCCNT